jgi:hypothetical protein
VPTRTDRPVERPAFAVPTGPHTLPGRSPRPGGTASCCPFTRRPDGAEARILDVEADVSATFRRSSSDSRTPPSAGRDASARRSERDSTPRAVTVNLAPADRRRRISSTWRRRRSSHRRRRPDDRKAYRPGRLDGALRRSAAPRDPPRRRRAIRRAARTERNAREARNRTRVGHGGVAARHGAPPATRQPPEAGREDCRRVLGDLSVAGQPVARALESRPRADTTSSSSARPGPQRRCSRARHHLPPWNREEAIEATRVTFDRGAPGRTRPPSRRPFRAPTTACLVRRLIGGGAHPRRVSLAHRGVLLIGEMPEFRRDALR